LPFLLEIRKISNSIQSEASECGGRGDYQPIHRVLYRGDCC